MNLIIRAMELSDVPALQALYALPGCFSGTLQMPFPSEDLWRRRLEQMPDSLHSLVAQLDGELVGQIGIEVLTRARRKHVANIGMAVSDAHQNQGIGSRLMEEALKLADNWMAVKRIELSVYTDNTAAIALYKKFGFQIEGQARDFALRDGEYVDAYYMARLKQHTPA